MFAALGLRLVQALLEEPFSSSSPILPKNTTLNVNYPRATGACEDPDAFRFVLTRINAATGSTAPDVSTCGTDRLPTENSIVGNTDGCFVSVSVMNATTKGDVDASTQAFILNRLGNFLTCVD